MRLHGGAAWFQQEDWAARAGAASGKHYLILVSPSSPTANSPPIWLCLVGTGCQKNPTVLANPSGSCPLICRAETLGRAPHDPPLRGFETMRSERKGSGEGDQETQSLRLLSLSHGSRGSRRNVGITVSVVALCLTS